jgi:O-antigen ligase
MHSALAVWADLGVLLTFAAFMQSGTAGREARRKAWWLVPWLLFIGLVIASCFNPSFVPMTSEEGIRLVHVGTANPWWPSTVSPKTTLNELAFGAGVYLAAFNLLIAVRSRHALRRLLVFGSVNAVVLAVLGTVQKLSAHGFYFGAAKSPNIRFFSTFTYYNHWGAFMVLWLAAAGGLMFYHAMRHRSRDLLHSPFTMAVMGVFALAVSAPVSASRAATAMTGVIVILMLAHAIGRIASHQRERGRTIWPPVLALLVFSAIATGAVGWLAYRSINERYTETRIAMDESQSLLDGRLDLYRDTWKLAMQKPSFGWGLESYDSAFLLIRPRPIAPWRQYEETYQEAHSDWIQSIAETGFVGTGLLLLMALIPVLTVPRRTLRHPLVAYPLVGCALIALYAWVEFPFAGAAVFISFWTVYFSAICYAQIEPVRSGES